MCVRASCTSLGRGKGGEWRKSGAGSEFGGGERQDTQSLGECSAGVRAGITPARGWKWDIGVMVVPFPVWGLHRLSHHPEPAQIIGFPAAVGYSNHGLFSALSADLIPWSDPVWFSWSILLKHIYALV